MSDEANAPKLPKEELLLKLLKMTTSSHDGEALAATRKANALLISAGWDWEKLIRAKIVVVADPFSSIPAPPTSTRHAASYAPSAPPTTTPPTTPPRPFAPSRPTPPPPPPLVGSPANPISSRPNLFAGPCHCCGIEVVAKAGHIFQSHNNTAWKIACSTCNTSATVSQYPAPPIRIKRKKSISDLA